MLVAMMSIRKNTLVIVATTARNWSCATDSVDASVAAAGLMRAERVHARADTATAAPAISAKEAAMTTKNMDSNVFAEIIAP